MNWPSAESAAFRYVKPRRAGSRRWSTEEGWLVLPRVPDDGPAPPDKTRSGTGIPPSICRTRPPRACRRRRPRAATSPAALAALSCLLCRLAHFTPPTSHPTTHHLQEKKATSHTKHPPPNTTINFSTSNVSPKLLRGLMPAANINRPCCTTHAPSTSLCGAADQHSTSSREVSSNLVDHKG